MSSRTRSCTRVLGIRREAHHRRLGHTPWVQQEPFRARPSAGGPAVPAARREPVRPARRLGQAVSRHAGQGPAYRGLEAHAMADRNVQRFHARAGAQHRADQLACIAKGRPCTTAVRGRSMHADEPRLGDADRRTVEQQPDVAGDPEAARVRNALAVVQDQIGRAGHLLERGEHRRRLPEREQPGNVGEPRRHADHGALHQRESREIEHRHRRARDPPVLLESDVDAGDAPHRADPVLAHDASAQRGLKRDRFLGREVPLVETARLHRRARAVQPAAFLALARNCLRNFCTLGATTHMQYGW